MRSLPRLHPLPPLITILLACSLLPAQTIAQVPTCADATTAVVDDQDNPSKGLYVRTGTSKESYVYYGPSNEQGLIDLCTPSTHKAPSTVALLTTAIPVRSRLATKASLASYSASPLQSALPGGTFEGLTLKVENSGPKTWWDTSGAAALITTLIAGIFGTVIAHYLQKRKYRQELVLQEAAKSREQDRIKLEGALAEERSVVASAYETISRALAAVDDLVALVTEPWRTGVHPTLVRLRADMWNSFMAGKQQWKLKRNVSGLLVALSHPEASDIQGKWKDLDHALESYISSAVSLYDTCVDKRAITPDEQNTLKSQYEGMIGKLDGFTACVIAARAAMARSNPNKA